MTSENMITRSGVVLTAVRESWRSTTEIGNDLIDRGFPWSWDIVRASLHDLHGRGLVERRRSGPGLAWRLVPAPEAPATAPVSSRDAAEILDELRAVIDKAQQPADGHASRSVTIGDDAPLVAMTQAQRALIERVVRRAAYDTGKLMLASLAGWVEAGTDQFTAANIRTMINDACRAMGAPEPWQAEQ